MKKHDLSNTNTTKKGLKTDQTSFNLWYYPGSGRFIIVFQKDWLTELDQSVSKYWLMEISITKLANRCDSSYKKTATGKM
jgi:hypothetical protein